MFTAIRSDTPTFKDWYAVRGFSLTWEDTDRLVASVTGDQGDRMVRCSPVTQQCVLLDTP